MEAMFKVPVETIYNKIDVINIRFSRSSLCGWRIEKPFDTKISLHKPKGDLGDKAYTQHLFWTLCRLISSKCSDEGDIKRSITIKLYGMKHVSENSAWRTSRFTKMKYGIKLYNLDEGSGEYLYDMISYIVRNYISSCTMITWR